MEWSFGFLGVLVGAAVMAVGRRKAPIPMPKEEPVVDITEDMVEPVDAVTVILQNIAVYDGTGRGQKEVPRDN